MPINSSREKSNVLNTKCDLGETKISTLISLRIFLPWLSASSGILAARVCDIIILTLKNRGDPIPRWKKLLYWKVAFVWHFQDRRRIVIKRFLWSSTPYLHVPYRKVEDVSSLSDREMDWQSWEGHWVPSDVFYLPAVKQLCSSWAANCGELSPAQTFAACFLPSTEEGCVWAGARVRDIHMV